jgi:hypothetical protein
MAEFASPQALLSAARQAYAAGYRKLDAYSPYHIEGLAEATGGADRRLPYVVLICGILGTSAGFSLQYFASVIDYPINIGGRPLNSWPAFIPITFETTVLAAAFGAVLGMLMLNGLPMPYHPVFNVPEFERASSVGFFLVVESTDPRFDPDRTRRFLAGLGPSGVHDVGA